jgi:arylsulfatase A-like enzyme
VPLVLRWPGKIPAGRRSNACISTVDLLPTFCGMLGVGYADSVDGIDLSDSTRVDCSCEPDFAYLRSGPKSSQQPPTVWRAVRDQHWTYARDLTSGAEFLFHNTTDPMQSKNLADHPGHIADRTRLRQWLAEKRLVLQD